MFTLFFSGWPVESQLNTFGVVIFLNAFSSNNMNFSWISANLNPVFSKTLMELSFSFQAGGIKILVYIPISENI